MLKTLLAFVIIAACRMAGAEVLVKDDTGATVSLPQPARRIITLAPHLVETLFAAGAGEKLVGTVQFSN